MGRRNLTIYLERMGPEHSKPATGAESDASAPGAAAAPLNNPFGLWRDEHGSILQPPRSASSSGPIAVNETFFKEAVEGVGTS